MLHAMLYSFIPAIVGFAAAFYMLHKIYSREEENGYTSGPRTYPNFQTGFPSTEGARQRRNDRNSGDRNTVCAVCFESCIPVQLYPCGHREICETCTVRIISRGSKLCPFCRGNIKGYQEVA